MIEAPAPDNESDRLAALIRYEVLDTEGEQIFDELTELASSICGAPISLISLVDAERQWFKSKVGLDASETSRSIAFCSHAILQDDVFQVANALDDVRFADNPLVAGAPDIRFYAGAPLKTPDGHAIGTLCVIDREAKQLSDDQMRALSILSKQVISQLEIRLQNRKLERLSHIKERMYAALAHDLRNPFNGILGFSRILSQKAEKLAPSRVAEIAQSILQASVNVFHVLDELLQWSQYELGSASVKLEKQPLTDLCHSAVEFLESALESKCLTVNNTIPDSLQVIADAAMVKTVLRNLLANATKYSHPGACIDISAHTEADDVIVSVRDHGVGMSADIAERLFAEMGRSTLGTAGEQGTGLGLALCKEFVALQGGRIWVHEHSDQGVCIQFSLKMASMSL